MTCPKCYAEFESGARACPECGVQLVRNISGVMKTSSVMIASGGEQSFYRSVQEVPEPLRSRLLESTHSANSGTIVIADRAGKDQLTQVVARRENARERQSSKQGPGAPDPAPQFAWYGYLSTSFLGVRLIIWAGLLLFLSAMAIITAVFLIHW
jgi:hypothetical protein